MLCNTKECCGCSACTQICPKNCIKMQTNIEGFLEPVIDKGLCVDCGACEQVCPVLNAFEKENNEKTIAYAAICKEKNGLIRKNSSSGGLFWCFSQWVFQNNGVVVGVALTKDSLKAQHIVATSEEELQTLMGSKYLQSEKGNIFSVVKKFLQEERMVLFVGTPCEVAGLLKYIPLRLQERLYTVDLICHGVPSPKVWDKYVKERKWCANKISFRDKTHGWKNFSLRSTGVNNDIVEKCGENLYMRGFLDHLYLRESCHDCKFKGVIRISDITLGDFWKIEEFVDEFNDDKGASLVFLHSRNGKELFSIIYNAFNVEFKSVDVIAAAESNPMTLYSSYRNNKRSKFFNNLEKMCVEKNVYKLTKRSFFHRIMSKIKRCFLKTKRGKRYEC